MNVKIAVAVGYYFAIVDSEDVKGIALKQSGELVSVNGESFMVYKGETFQDSQKIDDLMDSKKYIVRGVSEYAESHDETEYDVTITRYGCARVKAHSVKEAMEIANTLPESKISWSDDWVATDAISE